MKATIWVNRENEQFWVSLENKSGWVNSVIDIMVKEHERRLAEENEYMKEMDNDERTLPV